MQADRVSVWGSVALDVLQRPTMLEHRCAKLVEIVPFRATWVVAHPAHGRRPSLVDTCGPQCTCAPTKDGGRPFAFVEPRDDRRQPIRVEPVLVVAEGQDEYRSAAVQAGHPAITPSRPLPESDGGPRSRRT